MKQNANILKPKGLYLGKIVNFYYDENNYPITKDKNKHQKQIFLYKRSLDNKLWFVPILSIKDASMISSNQKYLFELKEENLLKIIDFESFKSFSRKEFQKMLWEGIIDIERDLSKDESKEIKIFLKDK